MNRWAAQACDRRRPLCWPKARVQALWDEADRILALRGFETEPDDWIADAAREMAVAAAIVEQDSYAGEDRNERAYRRVLAWMHSRHFNTNAHFRQELARRLNVRA